MIYQKPPEDFSPKFEAVGCFCERQGKFIVLRRHPERPQGGTWGLPSGGILPGEAIKEAARRELEEETGIKLSLGGLTTLEKSTFATRSMILFTTFS